VKPVLQSNCLAAGYDSNLVLNDVCFDLRPGEVMALLGPNGGGKSTLLKTLAGLIPKICGGVILLGDDLDTLNARDIARRIAFVPQEEGWQFDFSVTEVVSMGRLPVSNGYFETEEDVKAAEDAMKQTGCYDLRDRPVTELSGGERQRVLIARALAQETPIVFLDEPTSHLDPRHQVSTSSLVRGLAASGKSVLLAIHDLPTAATMADRGMLVYDEAASQVMEMRELLESDELDEAYETEFERVVTHEGRLVVVPRTLA
jgi:iron complex transport system ATP-binding protein